MEHICLIIDIGKHMLNDLDDDIAKTSAYIAVDNLIQKKIFSESKDEIALIFCGTYDTNNPLWSNESPSFANISIVSELNRANWQLLSKLSNKTIDNQDEPSDLLEAIYVAADHLVSKLRGRRGIGKKRIILFSNLNCNVDFSQMDTLVETLSKEMIEFNLVSNSVHSSQDENNSANCKGTDKISDIQTVNTSELRFLSDKTKGCCYSFKDALSALTFFESKSISQKGWKVNFQVSNAFSLAVVGYVKVKQARAQPLKLLYGPDFDAIIETKTKLHLKDVEHTPVEIDDTIKGFKYGKSIIPCTEEDTQSMKLEVEKSMKLIGFTEEESVPNTLFVGDGSMFFVVDNDDHAAAFTSLVYAMYSCKVVALVRKVYSKASSPRLGVLIPRIKSDHVSLVYNELAFGEDIRSYSFPDLLGTNSNTNKSRTFTDKEITSVDNLIDHMMLLETNEIGQEKELYKPSHIRNPSIQYFYQSVQHRYYHPHQKLPLPSEEIMATIKPPKHITKNIDSIIESIKENFPLSTKSPSLKKKMAADWFSNETNSIKKVSCVDNDKLVNIEEIFIKKINEVGPVDPIGDFHALLKQGEIELSTNGMKNRIWKLITDSYLTTFYPKALLCLKEMRKCSIEYSTEQLNLVTKFNMFFINLKDDIQFLSSKRDFWKQIVQENIGLISPNESIFSSVNQSELDKFLLDDNNMDIAMNSDDEFNDLFDDM